MEEGRLTRHLTSKHSECQTWSSAVAPVTVVDPHHLDADVDSTYHPDADSDADPDSDFLFDAVLEADPDPDPIF